VSVAVAATIYEAGNGFPVVGDYVPGDDGSLYQVTELGPRILTGSRSGESHHIPYCRVTLVDWSACEEGDEHTSRAVLGEITDELDK
jgi:hypothetical protein